MAWVEGLLGGFQTRKQEVEQENRRQAELSADRESRIFQALLASPDPEIQTLAATGLLESARPRKRAGGMRGWLGELEQSPILSQIQGLIQTPVQKTEGTLPQLGSTQYGGTGAPPTQIPTRPPSEAPAGMAAESLTEPGAAPAVTPLPRPVPRQIPAQVGTPPTFGPREVFASPATTARQQAVAKAQGDVEGEYAGLVASLGGGPEAEKQARNYLMTKTRAGMAGQTYAEGNVVPDASSPTGYSQELYLLADPTKKTRIPAQAPLTPETAAARAAAVTQARTGVAATAPLSTSQRFNATNKLQDDWRKIEGPHREMQRQYQLMEVGLNRFNQGDKTGGSQAVLVTFQKILDPESVVREPEYARSGLGLSLLARMEGYKQRLLEGGAGVPAQELAGMVETARQFLDGMSTWNALERQRIEGTAKEYGIDTGLITGAGAIGGPPPATTAAPAPATAPVTGGSRGGPVRQATPPPSRSQQSGPAGVFVDDQGNLVYR